MEVPFLDLGTQHASIRQQLNAAIAAVIDETGFSSGPYVAKFEDEFASYLDVKHCVGVNSGTTALHLALLSAGVQPGDEVVTTPHTWISTSWAITYCGAKPVFADIEPDTGSLSPDAAESAITSRTTAVLPVDLYGNPADHDAFEDIARRHGVVLVDDAAQSHGAELNGRRVGQFGQATCFSFYPGKNLGGIGEGGAVVTNDDAIAERVRSLRDHAQCGRHNHVEIGFNARMDGIQGAALSVKLAHLDDWNKGRREAAERYENLFAGIGDLKLPRATPGSRPSWHLYPVRVADRTSMATELEKRGIGTGVHYPTPIHLQPAYTFLGHRRGAFPAAENYAATCISLPMFPEISQEQQEYVASSVVGILEQGS